MSRPTDVEPDEGRQPTHPLVGRAVAEVREGDELTFTLLGLPLTFMIDRISFRDDGTTLHLAHADGHRIDVEHTHVVRWMR